MVKAKQPKRKQMARDSSREWFSTHQAQHYLGVGRHLLQDAYLSGKLRYVKYGHRTVKFRRSWLDEWAESNERTA